MTQAIQTTSTEEQVQVDDSPLTNLVGEGKKFKTVDDLAKGKLESDAFITKIQSENKELRDLVTKMSDKVNNLEKKQVLFASLNSNDNEQSKEDGTTSTVSTTADVHQTQAGLGEADVLRLVERREVAKVRESNIATVNSALVKEFGAEAKNVVASKAAELGLPVEYLFNMAETSPNAFFAAIGFQPNASRNSALTSRVQGVNSASTSNSNKTGLRNAAYYTDLSKKMGATKFALDRTIQVQMHKDMQALGDLFD